MSKLKGGSGTKAQSRSVASARTPRRSTQDAQPVRPVGDTDVAAMCNSRLIDSRSIENQVAVALSLCTKGLELRLETVQILESLLWPFIARRSLREEPFRDIEWSRFLRSMRETARNIKCYEGDENRDQTFVKFWLDSYMCQGFRDVKRPVRETWIQHNLFVGWCKRFVCRAVAKRDIGFLYSLSKGAKRAWPELGEVKKEAALAKHKIRVAREPTFPPQQLLAEISKTSQEIFERLPERPDSKFMPSGSACSQASRREGGALSLFSRYQYPWDDPDRKVIGSLPILQTSLAKWRNDQLQEAIYHAYDNLLEGIGTDVEVVAIPEPGKFRIITKGDGYLYTALQPLQGAMLTCWKNSRYSTMRFEDLTDPVRKLDSHVPDCPLWVSVDYEAATDLLERMATFAALSPCESKFWGELARASFGEGYCTYPDGEKVWAKNSQFMGHPLSFPLLCTINLAVYRRTLSRYVELGKSTEEKRLRKGIKRRLWHNVLVNGDDMLFKAPDMEFVDLFLETALQAGFKESVGKNYVSEDCCMINSQIFRRIGGRMVRIGYLNQKFLTGRSLKEGDSSATPTELGREVSRMLDLCPWARCVVPKIFRRFQGEWSYRKIQPNWYLPVHLGGYGVDVRHAPESLTVSLQQRLLAAHFLHDPRLALYRKQGNDLQLAKFAGALATWRLLSEEEFENSVMSSEVSDDWLARLAYAARASSRTKVSDRVFLLSFKRKYFFQPLSDQGLMKYWNARLGAFGVPSCPPIPNLRFFIPTIHDFGWTHYERIPNSQVEADDFYPVAGQPMSDDFVCHPCDCGDPPQVHCRKTMHE